jgi:hypothetical protein
MLIIHNKDFQVLFAFHLPPDGFRKTQGTDADKLLH